MPFRKSSTLKKRKSPKITKKRRSSNKKTKKRRSSNNKTKKRRSSNKKMRKLGGERSLPKNYAEKKPSRERELDVTDDEEEVRRMERYDQLLDNKVMEWIRTFLKPNRALIESAQRFTNDIVVLMYLEVLSPEENVKLFSLNYADKITEYEDVDVDDEGNEIRDRENYKLVNPEYVYPSFSFKKSFGDIDPNVNPEVLKERLMIIYKILSTLHTMSSPHKDLSQREVETNVAELRGYAADLISISI